MLETEAKPLNVLVVDDNEDYAKSMCLRFQFGNHSAQYITNAKDALKFCSNKNLDSVDYVLLDLFLNGVNGMDIYNQIQSRGCQDKVIFISGCDEKAEIFGRALATGAPIVVKTFDLKELICQLANGTVKEWSEERLKARGINR